MKSWLKRVGLVMLVAVMLNSIFSQASYANIQEESTPQYQEFLKCQKQELDKNPNASQLEIREKCQARTIPTDCNLEGAEGWFMCPLITMVGTTSDSSYVFIKDLLKIDVELFKTDTPTYQVWKNIRNIANIGLVLLFLMIIFSQITGYGISNYGLKKMLPKLVMATILINASFFLSQLLIDLSNILGSSVVGFFEGLTDNIFLRNEFSNSEKGTLAVTSISTLLLGIMTIKSVQRVKALYSIIMPMIVSFILVIVTTGLLLVVRKAAGVVLVVIAPIAFLSLIFPNLESGYRFWKKGMTGVIVMFPTIGMLFGAAGFVSALIINSSNSFLTQALGIVVSAMPLVFTPTLVKNAIASLPMVGQSINNALGKLQGWGVNSAKNSQSVALANLRNQRKQQQIADGSYQATGVVSKIWNTPERLSAAGNRFLNSRTKSGQARQYELDNQRFSMVSSLSDQISDQDVGTILSGNYDFNNLSDDTRRAMIANGYTGKNIGELTSAAMLRQAKTGELTTESFNHAIQTASSQNFNQSVINKMSEQARQASASKGRADMDGYIRGLQKEAGGVTAANINQFGSKETWVGQSYQAHLRTLGANELAKISKDSFTDNYKTAIKDLYQNDKNFAYTLDAALKDPNMSSTISNNFKDSIS